MTEPLATREITITRRYDAPPMRLFAMWTEPEHLAQWWGPDGFTVPRVASDPRPGGELVIVMAGHGFEDTMQARYTEVVPGERLVVESVVRGPDGTVRIASFHTVTFAEHGGRTEVTVHARAEVFDNATLEALAGMQAGWCQSLQKVEDVLTGANDRQIVLSHLYDAPPDAVFTRWTHQEDLEQWWGPDGFSITVEEIDVRPGGRWTFVMHGPDGTDFPNVIVFEEVSPPDRLVYVHGEPGDPEQFRSVVTFDEMDGRTALSMRLVFANAEVRDLVAEKYGAVEGGRQTLARLAALLPAASDA